MFNWVGLVQVLIIAIMMWMFYRSFIQNTQSDRFKRLLQGPVHPERSRKILQFWILSFPVRLWVLKRLDDCFTVCKYPSTKLESCRDISMEINI